MELVSLCERSTGCLSSGMMIELVSLSERSTGCLSSGMAAWWLSDDDTLSVACLDSAALLGSTKYTSTTSLRSCSIVSLTRPSFPSALSSSISFVTFDASPVSYFQRIPCISQSLWPSRSLIFLRHMVESLVSSSLINIIF